MLLSVSAASSDAVFAVGEWRVGNVWQPLALRYDGTRWRLQDAPSSSSGDGRLRAVSARAANDVWAVGISNDHAGVIGGGYGDPFALHFDGSTWSVVATPQPSVWGASALRGVLALRGQVLAVGCFENATQGLDTLILHLDPGAGGGFSVAPSTNIPGNGQGWNELFDVGRFGAELWTIGHGSPAFPGNSEFLTLVERAISGPRQRTGPPPPAGP